MSSCKDSFPLALDTIYNQNACDWWEAEIQWIFLMAVARLNADTITIYAVKQINDDYDEGTKNAASPEKETFIDPTDRKHQDRSRPP